MIFGFRKGGVGVVRVPAHLRALLCAQRKKEAAIVFLHLSSFAIRWTVPVPMPSDLATFRIPMPFASCFRTLRLVALSIFGGPSFTPWATARLRPALTRWRIMLRSNSAKDGGGDRPVQGDTGRSAGTENCRFAGGGRGDTQLVTEARSRFEGPYKSLQHQAQDWGSLTVKGG